MHGLNGTWRKSESQLDRWLRVHRSVLVTRPGRVLCVLCMYHRCLLRLWLYPGAALSPVVTSDKVKTACVRLDGARR